MFRKTLAHRADKTHDARLCLRTSRLTFCAILLLSLVLSGLVLSGCGVRKPPLPTANDNEGIKKPRYPPR